VDGNTRSRAHANEGKKVSAWILFAHTMLFNKYKGGSANASVNYYLLRCTLGVEGKEKCRVQVSTGRVCA
jgi:hypothetical protein